MTAGLSISLSLLHVVCPYRRQMRFHLEWTGQPPRCPTISGLPMRKYKVSPSQLLDELSRINPTLHTMPPLQVSLIHNLVQGSTSHRLCLYFVAVPKLSPHSPPHLARILPPTSHHKRYSSRKNQASMDSQSKHTYTRTHQNAPSVSCITRHTSTRLDVATSQSARNALCRSSAQILTCLSTTMIPAIRLQSRSPRMRSIWYQSRLNVRSASQLSLE